MHKYLTIIIDRIIHFKNLLNKKYNLFTVNKQKLHQKLL
jgi:hypothetical protein